MTGLGELFDEAEGRAASAARDARLEGDELGVVHTRVRRAHARRSALRASLVAVAVVVLGAGVAYGLGRSGETEVITTPSPSVSPSVTPSQSPSPSSSPSPSDTGFAWPFFTGSLSVDPHLPDAAVISREAWASAAPGWALISYREAWVGPGDIEDRGPQVIYLVSPQGDRYELVRVPGDTVSVLAWEPGSTTAAVSVQPEGDPPYFGVIDLVTAEVTPMDGYAPYLWSIAFLDSDGVPVWRGNDATSAYLRISPDGIQKDFKIPAANGAAELAESALGWTDCSVAAPFDETQSIVQCADNDGNYSLARVPTAGQPVVLYGDTGGAATFPSRAGDFVVAATSRTAGNECASEYSIVENGEATTVRGGDGLSRDGALFTPFGAHGNRLTWAIQRCSPDTAPLAVLSSDLATDQYLVLVPEPEDRPVGEDPYVSVTGVAVAH